MSLSRKEIDLFKQEIVACRDDVNKLDNAVDIFMNRITVLIELLENQQADMVGAINRLHEKIEHLVLQNEKGALEARKILDARIPFNDIASIKKLRKLTNEKKKKTTKTTDQE